MRWHHFYFGKFCTILFVFLVKVSIFIHIFSFSYSVSFYVPYIPVNFFPTTCQIISFILSETYTWNMAFLLISIWNAWKAFRDCMKRYISYNHLRPFSDSPSIRKWRNISLNKRSYSMYKPDFSNLCIRLQKLSKAKETNRLKKQNQNHNFLSLSSHHRELLYI